MEEESGYTNTTELEYRLKVLLTESISMHILMHAVSQDVYKVEKENNRNYFNNH